MQGALARGMLAGFAGLAVGVSVGIPLLHNASGGDRGAALATTSVSPTPLKSTSTKYPLPPLGAAGFPASLYPLPHPGKQPGTVASCPSTSGLELSTRRSREQAVEIVRQLETRSFSLDLLHTDRAYWPGIQAGWRAHKDWQTPSAPRQRSRVYILESGRLLGPQQPTGVPDLKPYVRAACGEQTLRDTIVAISGPTPYANQAEALQNADLFVVRHGRPLLYFSYP